jgi:hypothetical protein
LDSRKDKELKRNELKDLIKPLVKECVEESVKEIVLNSGLLSQVISEVVKGMSPLLTETKVEQPKQEAPVSSRFSEVLQKSEKSKLSETRKQLMDVIGKTSYGGINVFEGISETIPDEPQSTSAGPANPMSGIAPHDAGVDISGLFDINKAKILAQGKRDKK